MILRNDSFAHKRAIRDPQNESVHSGINSHWPEEESRGESYILRAGDADSTHENNAVERGNGWRFSLVAVNPRKEQSCPRIYGMDGKTQ